MDIRQIYLKVGDIVRTNLNCNDKHDEFIIGEVTAASKTYTITTYSFPGRTEGEKVNWTIDPHSVPEALVSEIVLEFISPVELQTPDGKQLAHIMSARRATQLLKELVA